MLHPQDAQITLGGELWTVEFMRRKSMPKLNGTSCLGLCYWDKKKILVRKDLCPLTVVDTLIHEMRHGQHRVLFEAESFVDWTSTELAKGLFETGIIQA